LPEHPEIVINDEERGWGLSRPFPQTIKSMNQQTQSLSPEALRFAIIDVMLNEFTPLIQLLKKWRAARTTCLKPRP
jgi:hypothetical protein